MSKTHDELTACLKELGLPTARACYAEVADSARREALTHEAYLLEVMARECQGRRQNPVSYTHLVLDICQHNRWKYFITFKEGSMPAVWKEYQTLMELCPQNRKEHTMPQGVRQTYAWVDNLEYVDDRGHRQRFNAFQCAEQSGADKTLFAWITNFTIRCV